MASAFSWHIVFVCRTHFAHSQIWLGSIQRLGACKQTMTQPPPPSPVLEWPKPPKVGFAIFACTFCDKVILSSESRIKLEDDSIVCGKCFACTDLISKLKSVKVA